MAQRLVVYLDMDNTLVDFPSAFSRVPAGLLEAHPERDEIPGIFALMEPMEGAIEAVRQLAHLHEVYIASTAPWGNPSAWQDKLRWVQRHFGEGPDGPFYKRVILTHHKELLRGDVLVDDRPYANGADRFSGRLIHFGPGGECETWPDVVRALDPTWSAAPGVREQVAL